MYISALGNTLWNFINSTSGRVAVLITLLGLVLWWFAPSLYLKFQKKQDAVKKQTTKLWLKTRFRLTITIFVIGILVFYGQYKMYQDLQMSSTNNEADLNKQISEVQTKLSSVDELIVIPLLTTDQTITGNNITVVGTPYFNPPYHSLMHEQIENNSPNNHLFEILVFQLSPQEYKFDTIDLTNSPADITIFDGYSGTNSAIVIVNDLAPLESATINFHVYTMDNDISIFKKETLNKITLDHRVLP